MSAPDVVEIKLVLIGNTSVGKTCIVKMATLGYFDGDSTATLGASYTTKMLEVNDLSIRLQIWDTAGQERYRGMTPMYYRGAQAALVVFSLTDQKSFDEIHEWINSLHDNADQNIIIYLVGNKSDAENERVISTDQGYVLAEQSNLKYVEVSAKTGFGIDDLLASITKDVLEASDNRSENENISHLMFTTEERARQPCC